MASTAVDPEIYFEGPWNSVLWDGRIYGVPRDANTLALYYNADMFEAANTFMAGGAAMAIGGPWELPRMESETSFGWRLTTLPVHDDQQIQASALGGYDYVIPIGANAVDGAFAFIEHMSDPEILAEGWATGRLAPRGDVTVPDPLWPQAYEIYRRQTESVRARDPHPEWPEISRPIQTAIQEALTGAKTPEDALGDAAARIQPILDRTPL